ncbi:hypothetical protein [Pseudomonas capsici]|uniref:hypothetical protein n=1 Tax=Pseudomonas capsici TaxID=2810614 RepID=UPI001910856A|nr:MULTISPECIES: hypothetical protein [Pseudomonas]MCV4261299.1 hypothetical protein [Pseudomonas capsici]
MSILVAWSFGKIITLVRRFDQGSEVFLAVCHVGLLGGGNLPPLLWSEDYPAVRDALVFAG